MSLSASIAMRWLWLMTGIVCIAGAANSQMASQQPKGREQAPVAIDALPSGVVAVLGSRGKLSVLRPETGILSSVKESLGYFTPVDMAMARLGQDDFVFITMFTNYSMNVSQTVQRGGRLVQYSLTGQEVRSWPVVGHTFTGIVVDPRSQVMYLGDAVTGEISKLDLNAKDASPEFVVQVYGISRLGPLALDVEGNRLFVGDVGEGRVYSVDLGTRKSTHLVSSLGEPAALTYDSTQHKLYIADAGRHCIWQVQIDQKRSKPVIFSPAVEYREPRGVALDAQRNLWVADYGARSILKLSAVGKVIQTIQH
jgi:sugar lactone lactonase YvrE